MNYLSPKTIEAKGALDESAPKTVSLYPNLGSRKAGNTKTKGRLSYCNGHDTMITAAQLRAARGLLDWTRADLAKAANISPETVKNIEHGTFRPQENTAEAIVKAFGVHDVEFTDNEGVQKKKNLVKIFTNEEGFREYLDHVYNVVQSSDPVTRHFNFSDVNLGRFAAEIIDMHNKRMSTVAGLDAKCLIPYGDRNFPAKYCEYRWLKKEYSASLPYYCYGDYVLFFMQTEPEFMLVSIYSRTLAESLRAQFDICWNNSAVPTGL